MIFIICFIQDIYNSNYKELIQQQQKKKQKQAQLFYKELINT